MAIDDEFEEIARANPDLAGEGPELITFRQGDEIAEMPNAEFEAIGRAVGEHLMAGTDWLAMWEPATAYPLLAQRAIAEGAYQLVVLRLPALQPYVSAGILRRVGEFLYFMATLRSSEEGANRG